MKLTETRWRYGNGYINLTQYGTYKAYVCLGHCKCRRRCFRTMAEAKAWILAGSDTAAPDQLMLEDALRAREHLPESVTLEEAARYWREEHKALIDPVSLNDAWDRYVADVRNLIRNRTMQGYRHAHSALVSAVGNIMADSVSTERMEEFMARQTPVQRNNYLRQLSAFFSWCVRHGITRINPTVGIAKARIAQSMPGVFAPKAVAKVLQIAREKQPVTVAYFALGFFAGLRPEEARRVRAQNIRNGYVVLDGSITKTADARSVKVRPNLAAWLAAYPIPANGTPYKRIRAVRAEVGAWPQDVARHSFATYAYELSGDATATAAEMGHQGTAVFFKHYRALATPGSGTEYFGIIP